MKRSFLLITVFILTISCGNSEKSKNGSSSIFKTEIDSPCEILSEAEIKEALSIPADAVTTMEEKEPRRYELCKYKWESVTYSGTVNLPGIVKTEKSFEQPAEMYITLVRDVDKKMYEQAISFYDDAESQDGIGEIATWSAKKRQVTFLSNGYLIHVYLRTSADEAVNKEQVIKMAKLMSAKV